MNQDQTPLISKSFRVSVWDPWMIVAQIITLQALYYLIFSFLIFIWYLCSLRYPTVYFSSASILEIMFSPNRYSWYHVPGKLLILITGFSAFFVSIFFVPVIQRAKQCLDFSATLYIIHLMLSILVYNPPVTVSWWITHALALAGTSILSEYWCLRHELRPIQLMSTATPLVTAASTVAVEFASSTSAAATAVSDAAATILTVAANNMLESMSNETREQKRFKKDDNHGSVSNDFEYENDEKSYLMDDIGSDV